MRTCAECEHMRNKIPVLNRVLRWELSKAYCRQGLISDTYGRVRRFGYGKIRKHPSRWYSNELVYQEWGVAETCLNFEEA